MLFARPGRSAHDFGDAAEGQMDMAEVVHFIAQAQAHAQAPAVSITVAEHLPGDALALQDMLARLPLVGAVGAPSGIGAA